MDYSFLDSAQILTSNEEFAQKLDNALLYLQGIKDTSKLVLDPRAALAFEYVRLSANSKKVEAIAKFNNIIEINLKGYSQKVDKILQHLSFISI